jgi:diguanylate cyclase (GGDEF)-like protein
MMLKMAQRTFEDKILLVITAAATLILLPFLISSVISGDRANIIVDGIAVGGFFIVFIGVLTTRKIKFFNGLFATIAYITILSGIYIKGAGLIYWLFPIVIASFYLLSTLVACLLNFLLISIAFLFTYDQFDDFTLPRIFAALAITVIFSLICSMFMKDKNRQLSEKDKTSQLQNHILELIASSSKLSTILTAVTHAVENELPDVMCSILLVDKTGKHLVLGAAPNLPDYYKEAVEGLVISQGHSSSGTAAYTKKRLIIDDVTTHPYWACYQELIKKVRLVACWSEPIIDNQGNLLGVLSIYHCKLLSPKATNFKLIEQFVNLARIALEQEETAQIIWQQANYDNLTKLPNRYLLQEQLASAINNAQRDKQQVAIAMLDLDKFKEVNDVLGHGAGDTVLIECSKRIQACIRKNDIAARLGGDEFIVVLVGTTGFEDIEKIGLKLSSALAKPYIIQDKNIYCTASIGFAFYPNDAQSIEVLIKNADHAMYRAKTQGRNNIYYFKK